MACNHKACKVEQSRIEALIPECELASKAGYTPPLPYSHYLKTMKGDRMKAYRRWKGDVNSWAHQIDIIRSKDNPSKAQKEAIIEEVGLGKYFSSEANQLLNKVNNARLAAQQVARYKIYGFTIRPDMLATANELEPLTEAFFNEYVPQEENDEA